MMDVFNGFISFQVENVCEADVTKTVNVGVSWAEASCC